MNNIHLCDVPRDNSVFDIFQQENEKTSLEPLFLDLESKCKSNRDFGSSLALYKVPSIEET